MIEIHTYFFLAFLEFIRNFHQTHHIRHCAKRANQRVKDNIVETLENKKKYRLFHNTKKFMNENWINWNLENLETDIAQWDENRKSVRFQRRHLSRTRPFLKPHYLEILMLNQKFFKYGFNYNWTNLSEKNKTIFENRFLKGGKIGLKMGYFQVPILDSCRRLPRYWHISL